MGPPNPKQNGPWSEATTPPGWLYSLIFSGDVIGILVRPPVLSLFFPLERPRLPTSHCLSPVSLWGPQIAGFGASASEGSGLGLGSKPGVLQEAKSFLCKCKQPTRCLWTRSLGVQVLQRRWRSPFLITMALPCGSSVYEKGPVLVCHETTSHSSHQSETGKTEIKREPGGEARGGWMTGGVGDAGGGV